MSEPKKLKYCVNGEWTTSKTENYMNCYNPSTGEVIAQAPQCTAEEVEYAIASAKAAYPGWCNTSVVKRVQVLYKMKSLVEEHMDELTEMLCREMGKAWMEGKGDILKVIEALEFACGMPHLMKGEALMDDSTGYDTTMYYESMGVFAGIVPWNFPAMIPQGWMAPLCIATGNCFILTKSREFCSSNFNAYN